MYRSELMLLVFSTRIAVLIDEGSNMPALALATVVISSEVVKKSRSLVTNVAHEQHHRINAQIEARSLSYCSGLQLWRLLTATGVQLQLVTFHAAIISC